MANSRVDRIERKLEDVAADVSVLKADVHDLGLQFEAQRGEVKLLAERVVVLDENMRAGFAQLRQDIRADLAPLIRTVAEHSRLLGLHGHGTS